MEESFDNDRICCIILYDQRVKYTGTMFRKDYLYHREIKDKLFFNVTSWEDKEDITLGTNIIRYDSLYIESLIKLCIRGFVSDIYMSWFTEHFGEPEFLTLEV